jgi:hypothetical protein
MARIDEARACSHALSNPLETLARREGDVGAAATLALLETTPGDKDGQRRLQRYGASPNALWRAVAARAAVGEELGPARRTFYTDGDERVRLAALRAALERGDHTDRRSLLEAARLDPNPLARVASSARRYRRWRDRPRAARSTGKPTRASPVDRGRMGPKGGAAAGGLRELIRVAETERGSPPIEAGWVLLRFTLVENAAPVGTGRYFERWAKACRAIACLRSWTAPLADPRVLDALRKAAATPTAVKVAALARLAESGDPGRGSPRAFRLRKGRLEEALYALARAGDRPAGRRRSGSDVARGRDPSGGARPHLCGRACAREADLLAGPILTFE